MGVVDELGQLASGLELRRKLDEGFRSRSDVQRATCLSLFREGHRIVPMNQDNSYDLKDSHIGYVNMVTREAKEHLTIEEVLLLLNLGPEIDAREILEGVRELSQGDYIGKQIGLNVGPWAE